MRRFSLPAQTLLAMVLGILAGIFLGDLVSSVAFVSKLVIQAIKIFAVPLLFFAILEAVLSTQLRGKGVGSMFAISFFNATCAVVIGLVVMNLLQPGRYLDLTHLQKADSQASWDWAKSLSEMLPSGVFSPFVDNQIPAAILLAVLSGLALNAVAKSGSSDLKETARLIKRLVSLSLQVCFQILDWIVLAIPIAVFCSVANGVAAHGTALFQGLAAYLGVCLFAMLLHVGIVYQSWIKLVAGLPLKKFWREAKEPALYAFGINSSLATLPVTLKRLGKLGVSESAATLSACVGTNFNNDGILLYEVLAALFVAQAAGIQLNIVEQLGVAGISVLATLGVAGIPEAGIIALTLVLSTTHLPTETLPMLLTVDWILARTRSSVNVISDMTVAVAIDHFET